MTPTIPKKMSPKVSDVMSKEVRDKILVLKQNSYVKLRNHVTV